MMTTILICTLAGVLAGVGTGFAGLSAAVFIAPMLIAFLGVDSFTAVGIALASDVLASAASAVTYARHGNIDLRHGWTLMVSVLAAAVAGTWLARHITSFAAGESVVSGWLIIATLVLGVNLLVMSRRDESKRRRGPILPPLPASILCGLWIGLICGFQGTGGGLWMLFVLNVVLGFPFKRAVGTSVCVMTFTALLGAVSHFLIGGMPDALMLAVCVISTLAAAEGSALIANRAEPARLKQITGVIVIVSGLIMLWARYF